MTRNNRIVTLQSSLLAIVGIGLIIQPIVELVTRHFSRVSVASVNPFGIPPSVALTMVGILLLYLTPYLYKRRKVAYAMSIALTTVAFFIVILRRHTSTITPILLVGFVGWMVTSYRLYKVKSDLVSLVFGIRLAVLIAAIGWVYGLVGFLLLGPVGFHQSFGLQEAATLSVSTLFTLHNSDAPTAQAELFIHSLDVLGTLIFILLVTSLFKPVRFALSSSRIDKKRAHEILEATSRSSEDYFKLWPDDKRYYFSSSRNSFLAYKTTGRTAIVLGDPCGQSEEFADLIRDFHAFVTSNGWLVAAINGTHISEELYRQKGLSELFIGNEAIIMVADFIRHTSRSKHFRYVYNKAIRDGLTVEHWQTIDEQQMAVLRHISNEWLSQGGRKEYTFFMGYFDADYLRAGSVMVVKQHDTVVGYVNLVPSFVEKEASIDHLRSTPVASSVSMHYLLAQVIDMLHKAGKTSLNIGLAPLSGIELEADQPRLTGGLLRLIKKFGERLYSFQGVEQFKGKSDPVWYPRYLYYTGGVASLATIARDLDQSSRLFGERTRRWKIIGTIATFVAIVILVQFM
jgi:phosphatidylglycerol lysyltransferase